MRLLFRRRGSLCIAVLIEAVVLSSLLCIVTAAALEPIDLQTSQQSSRTLRTADTFLWLGRQCSYMSSGGTHLLAAQYSSAETRITHGLTVGEPNEFGVYICELQLDDGVCLERLYACVRMH